jgi:hypothetical protein
MHASPTVHMEDPPEESPRDPSKDQLDKVNANLHLPISVVGSAGRLAGDWVGVSIHAVFLHIRSLPPITERESIELAIHAQYTDPGQWWSVHGNTTDDIVSSFREAEQTEWITIERGYAYPTQKLAAFLCG